MGVIPRYEISPKDGSLVDGVFFYKDLSGETSTGGEQSPNLVHYEAFMSDTLVSR